MKQKQEHVLLIILIIGCCVCFSMLMFLGERPLLPSDSSFELQEKYATSLENKLVNLLEPATGLGNVKASVQAEIRSQNTTQTYTNLKDTTRTVMQEHGPVLVTQSVSVLINDSNKQKLPTYQKLIQGAIGFDPKRGDQLVVETLPFVPVPLWTLGLTPVLLVRIGVGLVLLILGGFFWLIKECLSSPKRLPSPPDEHLWHQVSHLSAQELAPFLKINRPELSAFILYRLPEEKASEIVELLPPDYMNQVVLHLETIEKLSPVDQEPLLRETENRLRDILRAIHLHPQTRNASSKNFDILKNWSDSDLQNLLHYVSKKDLIKALQTASLPVQGALSRNIPPALWQSLIQQAQLAPCSQEESLKAQQKIMHLAKLLKEDV